MNAVSGAPKLGLVVPVFNEVERLGEFVDELMDFVDDRSDATELIFVDDGSSDDTSAEIERRIVARPATTTRLLRRPHIGKGAAVSWGLCATAAEVVAFCDLDLSTPLESLERIITHASDHDALSIGSRDAPGSVLVNPEGAVRQGLGRLYNRLLRATITPGIVDTQCGAKAARAAVWRRILPHCRQRGFAWDAEVVAIALSLGTPVAEIPIIWRHDARTRVNVLEDGIKMVAATPGIWRSARRASVEGHDVTDPGL